MTPDLTDHFPPRRGRTHEVQGASAVCFALALGGQIGGTVLWVQQGWQARQLNPLGVSGYLDPGALLIAKTGGEMETLAVAEEALRSGAASLVVIELTAPLALTPGRRLQLAAETGRATGLCLMPDGMGSNAAETRWHCAPLFDPDPGAADSTLMQWEIKKNKSGTLAAWDVRRDAETRRVIMVSKAGELPDAAGAAG